MRRCLDLLYERIDDDRARSMLRDPDLRAQTYLELATELTAHGMPEGMFQTSEGESLGLAILALRLRFPQDVGVAKVELNIAMREGRA